MSTLRPLIAINGHDKTLVGESKKKNYELMLIDILLSEKPIRAMFDTNTTHNFVFEAEVRRLGLVLSKDSSRIKLVNTSTRSIASQDKDACIKVRS